MYNKLLEYQEEDKKLKAIDDGLRANEDYKKYNVAGRFLKTVTETRTQIEQRAEYLLSQLAGLEKKYARLLEEKAEFSEIDDAEEESTVNFLKKKSSELSASFAEMEKEIDKLNKEMTELVNQYKKLMTETKTMKETFDACKEEVKKLQAEVEGQKAEITKRLEELAKGIPSDLMEKYRTARKSNKFPLVYVVDESECKHCVACGTEFSALSVTKLKKDRFIECENCRKLIFIKN